MANCNPCAYAVPIKNGHVTCAFNWLRQQELMPLGNQAAVQNGNYNFPLNFDPQWMISKCPQQAAEREPAKTMTLMDMQQLARLLFGN